MELLLEGKSPALNNEACMNPIPFISIASECNLSQFELFLGNTGQLQRFYERNKVAVPYGSQTERREDVFKLCVVTRAY